MEEGVPPTVVAAQAAAAAGLRAELQALTDRQLDRRAAKAGVSEDKLDQADAAEDPKAFLIDLIIEAEAVEANIQQRLDLGEWKTYDSSPSKWWQQPDVAEQVMRLRAAARIRDSLPGSQEIPDLYPQLVVLGDGNTGKSTVLNRFADYAFSAVTDGVCTRRPVRLQLRPVRAENRERMQDEDLLAICTMKDMEDDHEEEFKFRAAHREEDEGVLRHAVESRASEAALQDGTSAAFDRQYITEELVITIEANQMIYFDLLDVPGLDNSSEMPKKMVRSYLNKHTMPRTFVLIFAEHKQGDTQLMHSLAFSIMKDVTTELDDADAWQKFITERCLGVLTKVDKELESNSDKGATEYNNEAAAKLRRSLMCEEHPAHLDKWPWVAVLNPNKNEQIQNMSFDTACQKEAWFFDELYKDDEVTRNICGINNFRAKLIDLYAQFVTAQMKLAAPMVFAKVLSYQQHMAVKWAWDAQEECYENSQMMMAQLRDMINALVQAGKGTSRPLTSSEILFRDDVNQCFDRCRRQMDPHSAVENCKQDILSLMASMTANLIEQVHVAACAPEGRFRRFVTIGKHLIKVLVFLTKQFLHRAERSFDTMIAEETERHRKTGNSENIGVLVQDLLACAKSELLELAIMVEELPLLPPQYMVMDPPDYLEHTRPLTTTAVHPFGFVCNVHGLVTKAADAETCDIVVGSTIMQINGQEFSLQSMLEVSQCGQPVRFTFSKPGCSVLPDDYDVTRWLYHYQHVSREYLEERERFFSHRRAAENLILVFGEETMQVNGREEFEFMQGDRQLIMLDPDDDCDWYQPRYHGVRVTLPETREDLQLSLPGWCCTEGCSQAHDTAFYPCGHTVCCWECANTLDRCPVCCTDLTVVDTEQVRRSRVLCYDDPSQAAEHADRLHAAKVRDSQAYQAAKADFQALLLLFRPRHTPEELDEESWETLIQERRRQLQARPDLLPGQSELWPYHKHMVENRNRERRRAADDIARQRQECADDIARQRQECADDIARQRQECADDIALQQKKCAEAVATVKQECAATVAAERQEHKDQRQQLLDQMAQQQAAFDADLSAQFDTAACERQQLLDQMAQQQAAFDADLSAQFDTAACERQLLKVEMIAYAQKLEDALYERDARVKKEVHVPDDLVEQCQAPLCSSDFKLTTRKHHCRACGGIFCADCTAKKGFTFDTADTKGAEQKARRVCRECQTELFASNGVRNRKIPAKRPDGTMFGSHRPD